MTLNFVTQLEKSNDKLQIATPTEKLMYLMIAFMGPDSQFLDGEMQELLRQHLMEFYTQSQNVMFQFDEIYQGKKIIFIFINLTRLHNFCLYNIKI